MISNLTNLGSHERSNPSRGFHRLVDTGFYSRGKTLSSQRAVHVSRGTRSAAQFN